MKNTIKGMLFSSIAFLYALLSIIVCNNINFSSILFNILISVLFISFLGFSLFYITYRFYKKTFYNKKSISLLIAFSNVVAITYVSSKRTLITPSTENIIYALLVLVSIYISVKSFNNKQNNM